MKQVGRMVKTKDINSRLQHLVPDEELILDGGEHWVALVVEDGTYLAAWVDEGGIVRTRAYKSASRAVKRADSSWGR